MVDAAKLAALRERYADATGADGVNPEFRRVADTQFQGDRRKWPFMDPATFLGAPFRPNAAASGYADLDVALVGVPMDLGVTNRAGARLVDARPVDLNYMALSVSPIDGKGTWSAFFGGAGSSSLVIAKLDGSGAHVAGRGAP